jgi:alpha-mannosidase
VSGETIVRDLQLGLERATAFGGAMEVGYLPDMFGHVAQMPQLLRQFGFEHAVVWRGVPSSVDRSGFWWEAPDGSTVRAEYLPQGYGNGAPVPDDAKQLVRRVAEFEGYHGDLLVGPILWMDGTDHMPPQPWLGRVVAEANEIQDDYRLTVTSLAAYLAEAPTGGLPTWHGELRSGARANLLMGVASNRVDVKQAAARAERAIERLAEPLSALLLPADRWPGALLREAWLLMVRNAAHDSICACSVDEVCDAVLHRYAEARQIGDGLARRALAWLGLRLPGEGRAVVNPSARERSGVVELTIPGEDVPDGTQLVSRRPPAQTLLEGDVAMLATVVLELEHRPRLTSVTLVAGDGSMLLHAERDVAGQLVTPALRAALRGLADARGGERVRLDVTQPPTVRVLARAAAVPGFGWQVWEPAPLDVPPVAVDAAGTALSNGLVSVAVDTTDGTWSIDGHGGLGQLVDSGDAGDTYNYCPPVDDAVVDAPVSVAVRTIEAGPVRAQLEVRSRYEWAGASVDVRTVLELRAGERLVRVTTALDNRTRDHRLRAVFPLPARAASSQAECAFAVVERGLEAEGGPTEQPMPTFPSRRFVRAGSLTLVHEGLLEYELIDGGRALALTLLRCTGLLSQGPMTTRPLPAGPIVAMEGPQLQGAVEVRYAVQLDTDADAVDVDPYALADDAFLPLQVTRCGGGDGPATGQALAVTGAEVSAVVREGGSLHVRVFNPSPTPSTVTIEGRSGWLVDLRGRPLEPFDGSFALGPWRIATAALSL